MSVINVDQLLARATHSRPYLEAGAQDPLQNTIEATGETVSFDPNEEIYAEEDLSLYLYKVRKGTVRLCRLLEDGRRQISAFLVPGDMFGLELGDCHSFSAEAVEACEISMFDRRGVQALAQINNSVAMRLWELTAQSGRRLQEHILLLGRMTAKAKVATFLLSLADRIGVTELRLAMARHDIGDHLGLTLETVSRTLTQLENEGFIRMRGARAIDIMNSSALKRLAA